MAGNVHSEGFVSLQYLVSALLEQLKVADSQNPYEQVMELKGMLGHPSVTSRAHGDSIPSVPAGRFVGSSVDMARIEALY